jgi:hypothetical protein
MDLIVLDVMFFEKDRWLKISQKFECLMKQNSGKAGGSIKSSKSAI